MKTNEWQLQKHKNLKLLALWTIGWMLSMALITFGPIYLWNDGKILTLFAFVLNLGLGIGMIISNRNYINGADELEKKMTFDAMAIALGVGVVGGLSYSALEKSSLININADISYLVMLIAITYLIAIVAGKLRYK